jgi:hypothetical protein
MVENLRRLPRELVRLYDEPLVRGRYHCRERPHHDVTDDDTRRHGHQPTSRAAPEDPQRTGECDETQHVQCGKSRVEVDIVRASERQVIPEQQPGNPHELDAYGGQ